MPPAACYAAYPGQAPWCSSTHRLLTLGDAYLALAFASPAQQALDVWLLDTKTMGLTQLPAMPTLVPLKRTNMAWTDDGQLVLLTQKSGKLAVALWRPGEKSLTVKTLPLRDQRDSSSDSFAVLR